jgi:hypothetical protein
MSLQQLRNCNMGRRLANATGSNGVGYTLVNYDGSTYQPRTVTGVYQVAVDSGIYSAYITFPDQWRGQILWDTGAFFSGSVPYFATEQYNYEENNPRVDSIYNIEYGRWRIVSNQMVFYKDDNVTEVARFNLFDENGAPTMDAVFERQKV